MKKYMLLVASISFSIIASPVHKTKQDKVQQYETHKKDRQIREQRRKANDKKQWLANPHYLKKQSR